MLWDFVPLPIRGQKYRCFSVAFFFRHRTRITFSIFNGRGLLRNRTCSTNHFLSLLVFDLELVQISWISKCALCRSRSGWWLKMPGNKSVHVVLHGHCHRAWHLCSRRRCELGRSKSEWKLLVNLNARACFQRFFFFLRLSFVFLPFTAQQHLVT